jgi:hypothetical protein
MRYRVERPARGENELVTAREGIDARSIEPHNREAIGAVAEGFSIVTCDIDLVADRNVLEKTKMGVAVGRIDGNPGFAGIGGALHMAGPECERLPASTIALALIRATVMRASGQVSAQGHGLTAWPVAIVSAKARCSNTCASIALA